MPRNSHQIAEALLMHRPGAPAFTIKADGDTLAVKQVKVFIELDDIGVLEQIERLGGKVYTDFGNCVTASVPVASLRDISELEGIKFIEMGSPVNLLMDKARVATGVDIVHLNSNKDLPNPYTGKGVVIGIIDTGMEYGHLDFYTSDGKECRLKRVWNQNGIKCTGRFQIWRGIHYDRRDFVGQGRYRRGVSW